MDEMVGIGKAKRIISELVSRVAESNERIILTSRGKPKAALVSIEDYEKLRKIDNVDRKQQVQTWIAEAQLLSNAVRERRGGKEIEVDRLLFEQAMVDRSQAYFWTKRWQAGEREAEVDLEAGRYDDFDNIEDLLEDLDN